MKKIFTLALASAAVLSASASQPASPVVLGQALAFEGGKVATDDSVLENSGIVSRAEDLANDGYITASYTRYPNTKNPGGAPYSMLAPSNDITIKADPDAENGYIIENLLNGMFFNDENPGSVNALKATYDPERQVLSIAPHQLMLNYTFQDGQTVPLDLMAVDPKNYYNPDIPIEFTYRYGQLRLNPETTQGMTFLQKLDGDSEGQFLGVDFVVFDYIAWVPNGTMTYYDLGTGEEQSCPILGVSANGRNAIYNFAGYDRFHFAPLLRDGDKVNTPWETDINDLVLTTQVILNNPDMVNGDLIVDRFYLTRIDDSFYPYYDETFYIEGDIRVNTPEECVITLPACGLFSENDTRLNCFDEVEISYNPNAIAGIESVGAGVDNTDAPVVYYNLQGVRVGNPQSGIFIRQQGTEATKVLVK